MQRRPSFVLVLDFDGTVTVKDIGDEVCDRFAPPEWKEIDAAWVRNEITLPEAQRRMWKLVRAERHAAAAFARSVGRLRDGLDALIARVTDRGGALWLASGGFDFYIEALLDGHLPRFQRVYFNTTRFHGDSVEIDFPHAALACDRCAVCKGKVCDLARAEAERVVFVGDGSSDRCAIARADTLYAVAGSLLARTCDDRGAAYVPFTRFDEIAAAL
jgi:2-hydroxy-3-keto-5-methylthiopentenyl-1-phosphate phosphatase